MNAGQVAARTKACKAQAALVRAYRAEARALTLAARDLERADLDTLRRVPLVGRGARLRAVEDELDAALAALE